jgi:hypothetical protein
VSTREHNERKFSNWESLPAGGRRYRLDVFGKQGWKARYVKEVDANEVTVRFYQEIYDDSGKLVEVHNKYPVDEGHQKVTS